MLTLMPQPISLVPDSLNCGRHGMSSAKSSQSAAPLNTPAVAVTVVRIVGRGAGRLPLALDRDAAARSGRRPECATGCRSRTTRNRCLRSGSKVSRLRVGRAGRRDAARVDRERLAGESGCRRCTACSRPVVQRLVDGRGQVVEVALEPRRRRPTGRRAARAAARAPCSRFQVRG